MYSEQTNIFANHVLANLSFNVNFFLERYTYSKKRKKENKAVIWNKGKIDLYVVCVFFFARYPKIHSVFLFVAETLFF